MIFARLNQGSLTRPGSGIPMYDNIAYIAQRRSDVGSIGHRAWLCPEESGIPFQFGYTCTGATAFRAVGALPGGVSVTLGAGLLDQQCYDGDKTYITYDGANFPTALPSGLYYYEVVTDGGTVRSDYFYACTDTADACVLLQWSDTKDQVGTMTYTDGYVNKMWIDTNFVRPRMDYLEEANDDGFGGKEPIYQRSEEIYGFDVLALDSQLNVLHTISHHNTITITPAGGSAVSINTFRVTDTGDRKDAIAIIECSFKVDYVESNTIDEVTLELGTC